jgi:hypothetical protein
MIIRMPEICKLFLLGVGHAFHRPRLGKRRTNRGFSRCKSQVVQTLWPRRASGGPAIRLDKSIESAIWSAAFLMIRDLRLASSANLMNNASDSKWRREAGHERNEIINLSHEITLQPCAVSPLSEFEKYQTGAAVYPSAHDEAVAGESGKCVPS